MEPIERAYNAWVVVRPAEDLPDQWVAHVLDFDIVTQGNTIEQAIQMAGEATLGLICDDLVEGEDPMLRRAPEHCWEVLWETMKHGSPLDPAQLGGKTREDVHAIAVQLVMAFKTFAMPTSANAPRPVKPTWKAPVAFESRDGAAHC